MTRKLGWWLGMVLLSAVSAGMAAEENWIQLFNGKDLDGWTPKIRGCKLGENFQDTYRVKDGTIAVCYDQYEKFDNRFGHLFYKTPFSHYRLRIEYRFVGDQAPGGAGWALRNSGVMIHCQAPETMGIEQDFPVSIEVQFLGGKGKEERATGNLCTPGTNVEIDGKLVTQHVINSKGKTYHGDQWVIMEVEVQGGDVIRHIIDGKVIHEYRKPQYDPNDGDAKKLIVNGNLALTGGYIALQAESHPVQFRKVELLPLAAAAATAVPKAGPWVLGVQAYTFRNFTFMETVDKIAGLGLAAVEAYPGQRLGGGLTGVLRHDMDEVARDAVRKKLAERGVKFAAYGVVNGGNPAEWRAIFEFAKAMGVPVLSIEPAQDQLDTVEALVKEFGITVGLHNHATPSRYWDPATVLAAVQGRDARLGACGDTGHWARSGLNAVDCMRQLDKRLVSVHLKDANKPNPSGSCVPFGTGVADMAAVLKEMAQTGYSGLAVIEHEANPEDPMPDLQKCVDFVKANR